MKQTLAEYFYAALHSSMGVALLYEGCTFDQARAKLYTARKALNDPLLEQIAIVKPPREGEIWLVKKEQSDGGS